MDLGFAMARIWRVTPPLYESRIYQARTDAIGRVELTIYRYIKLSISHSLSTTNDKLER